MEKVIRPQAVIFDIDGTLADSFQAIMESLNHALEAFGFSPKELAWVKYHVGYGAGELLRAALGGGADRDTLEQVGKRFGEHYRATFLASSPPMLGARDVLSYVWSKTGGKVAVASNKYASLSQQWLQHWELSQWVACIIGPDNAQTRKPDGAFLAVALQKLAVNPEDALYVGDMEVDVEAGKAADVPVVGLAGPSRSPGELWAAGATFVIEDLRQLPELLREEGWGWEE